MDTYLYCKMKTKHRNNEKLKSSVTWGPSNRPLNLAKVMVCFEWSEEMAIFDNNATISTFRGEGVTPLSRKMEQVLPSTRSPLHCTHCDDLIRVWPACVRFLLECCQLVRPLEGDRTACDLHFWKAISGISGSYYWGVLMPCTFKITTTFSESVGAVLLPEIKVEIPNPSNRVTSH